MAELILRYLVEAPGKTHPRPITLGLLVIAAFFGLKVLAQALKTTAEAYAIWTRAAKKREPDRPLHKGQ